MSKRICSIDDCERPQVARGYCKPHYRSWRKYGDPLVGIKNRQIFDATHKLCPDCGTRKLLADFAPNRRAASGRNTYCHECQNRRTSIWLTQRSAEQIAAAKERRRRRTVASYGIDVKTYDQLLAAQGGGCVCGAVFAGGRWRNFHVDHDHATGAVRGVLCHSCNTTLGLVNEDPDRLRLLAAYLEGGGDLNRERNE